MKTGNRFCVVIVCLLASAGTAFYQAQTTADLVDATHAFLASLTAEQAAKATFEFSDQERLNWAYTPVERKGLPMTEMQPHQKSLVHAMMAAALGYKGVMKATTVMSLETVLREIEWDSGEFNRDPELYFVSIFGEPSRQGRWGWRFEGHHVAVNVTMTDGEYVATSPTFLGSNPAEILVGPRKGLRVLGREEDLARELLHSLNPEARKVAVIQAEAPRDIITSNFRKASIEGEPEGLSVARMTEGQKALFLSIVEEYANRMVTGAEVMETIREDMNRAFFAWAGPADRGAGHYYRIQGPWFLIEYDNTQNSGNHVHSVFRDFENDFGDTLLAHYQDSHATGQLAD